MPEPVRVWAVELGPETALDERKGTLALEADALVFTPAVEGRPGIRIPLEEIAKVRRLRGSPVLMVARRLEGTTRRTAFYFAQPPPLGVMLGRQEDRRAGLAALRNPKRRARRENVTYLGLVNRDTKPALAEWARAIRAATRTGSDTTTGTD
jgi:hypothetical protein